VRSVVEVAGIRDLSAKILGGKNQASNVYATFEALKQIQHLVELKGVKLRSIVDIEKEEAEKLAAEQTKALKVSVSKNEERTAAPKAEAKKVVAKKPATKPAAKKVTEKKA
jgi:hypothetical protein